MRGCPYREFSLVEGKNEVPGNEIDPAAFHENPDNFIKGRVFLLFIAEQTDKDQFSVLIGTEKTDFAAGANIDLSHRINGQC